MHGLKQCLLIITLTLFGMQYAQALAILEKLDQVAELNKLSVTQRSEGRHQLIVMLTNCEFAEPCLLQMIDELKSLSSQTKNPMYQVYGTYLQANKAEFIEKTKHCDIPEKKAVRKVIAQCLQEMDFKETRSKNINRKVIDQFEDEREVCVKEKIELLAKEDNLFAAAMLVNFYEQTRDQKNMDYWYKKMEEKANTPAFKSYLACPDIP